MHGMAPREYRFGVRTFCVHPNRKPKAESLETLCLCWFMAGSWIAPASTFFAAARAHSRDPHLSASLRGRLRIRIASTASRSLAQKGRLPNRPFFVAVFGHCPLRGLAQGGRRGAWWSGEVGMSCQFPAPLRWPVGGLGEGRPGRLNERSFAVGRAAWG